MANDNASVVVGSTTVGGSVYEPWPQTWQYPQTYIYPTYTYTLAEQEYANEVEVDRGEYDAVLRFYRRKGTSRTLVKEMTVPLGVLEWLTTEREVK